MVSIEFRLVVYRTSSLLRKPDPSYPPVVYRQIVK